MAFYVISERAYQQHVAWGISYELEDIMVRTCGAQIIAPAMKSLRRFHPKLDLIFGRWLPFEKVKNFQFANEKNVLLLVGMGPFAIPLLDKLPGWRQKCDVVAAYIMDVYPRGIDSLATAKMRKITDKLDHLFVSYEQSIPPIQQNCKAPVSLLLQAADVLTHGAHGGNRWIDLISYGRRFADVHKKLQQAFNCPQSQRLYYHTTFDFGFYPNVQDYREHRMIFFQMLRRAKISLNYRFTQTTPWYAKGICPLTARWFEAAAAGAVIVGTKPTGPEAAREFDWPDAVIDFPEPNDDPVGFVTALLEDEARLRRTSRRNYYEALRRHDWRHRIRDVLLTLKQPIPPGLDAELTQLENKAQAVGPGESAAAAPGDGHSAPVNYGRCAEEER